MPWIFEHLEFHIQFGSKSNQVSYQDHRHEAFCRRLLNENALTAVLAGYTQSCCLSTPFYQLDSLDLSRPYLSLSSRAIGHMRNLLQLSLRKINIDKEIILAMVRLPLLQALTIENCYVSSEQLHDGLLRELASLKLIYLSCHSLMGNMAEKFPRPFDISTLLTLRTDRKVLFRKLAQARGDIPLEALDSCDFRDNLTLSSVLENTPGLQSFRSGLNWKGDGPFHLSPQALPRLSSAEATLDMLCILVPGRPIKSIKMRWPSTLSLADILLLKDSTCNVTHLDVPDIIFNRGFPFWSHFSVQTLKMRCTGAFNSYRNPVELDGLMINAVRTICVGPKQTSLQSLCLDFTVSRRRPADLPYWLNLSLQYKLLTDFISPQFPALLECQFDEFVSTKWYRTNPHSKWKPSLLAEHVAMLATDGKVDFSDHEFYISRLLKEIK
ncbi:hypothetical protein CVT26_005890 [Gymnopilus dilepis]|uniref:F-box domain-containing protein n=1 Tax=Gymnopilus dilepis TaxID=231916 RepID=A0A409Y1H6_9AGAR|nr:hypothetical protein CVT26_005890 [Gymnopilus dilepis]